MGTAQTRSRAARFLGLLLLAAAALPGAHAQKLQASTTALTVRPQVATVGQAIAMTATVTGKSPTGVVTFLSGSTALGTATLAGSGKTRTASFSTAAVPAGTHSVTARFAGDSDDSASVSAAVTLVVNRNASTTALSIVPNPSTYGQAITLTATVTGAAVPSGTVTFKIGATTIGSVGIGAGGVARLGISSLGVGSHGITAAYGGDSRHEPSTSAVVTQAVGVSSSSTALVVTPAVPTIGEVVILAATVTGSNVTGSVTFLDGGFVLGAAPVNGGMASLGTSSLVEGLHLLSARYGGDAGNGASTSAIAAITVAAPAGSVWRYEYDAMGRLTKVTDPNNLTTSIRYDKLGRAVQTEQPASTLIKFGYDPANNLTSVVDPRQLTTTYAVSGLGSVKAQASPDSGSSSYTYDSRGQLQSATDARSKQATYVRDEIGRVTRITYPSGTGTTFEYDGGPVPVPGSVGKLTKMTDESGQTVYTYDSRGRMTGKSVTIGTRTFTVAYGWGTSGTARNKLTSITYPSGSRVNYSYDAKADVSAITVNPVNANGVGVSAMPITLMTNITYNVDWNPTGWQWSDGKPRTIGYDAQGNVTSYNLGDPEGTGNKGGVNRVVARDAAGRIRGYTHSGTGAMQGALDQVFAYDSLNRLTSQVVNGTSHGYAYDATGNRTSKTIGGATYTNTIAANSNRLTQTQDTGGTAAIVHDAAGNITSDGTNTYTYNDRGRMTSATTPVGVIGFKYNGLEQRASKSVATATYYVYDEAGQLLGEYDLNGNPVYETAYLGMMPVGVLKQTGSAGSSNLAVTLYNVHADQIATPRVITRQDHAIVWRWDAAEAFGAAVPNQNPSGVGVFVYNQRFPGQVADSETGLHQNWNRDFNARNGRYIQSDRVGLAGGINTFAYAEGSPLVAVDRLGLWSTEAHNYFMAEFARSEGFGAQYGYMDQMMKGSRFADSSRFQDEMSTYMHAMSSGAWSPDQAKTMMCSYIKAYLGVYRSMMKSTYPSDWGKAHFYLGMAMHAVMDSTSPVHRGFQRWGGTWHSAKHGYGFTHGPLPTSKEDISAAPAYREETLRRMRRAFAGDLSECGCD